MHIFSSCKTALLQGRYSWRHDSVLKCLNSPVFPAAICITSLRPDIIIWPPTAKVAILLELTCPSEESILQAKARNLHAISPPQPNTVQRLGGFPFPD
jgi:hypothetical protein